MKDIKRDFHKQRYRSKDKRERIVEQRNMRKDIRRDDNRTEEQ
jgi:hypothetical protein